MTIPPPCHSTDLACQKAAAESAARANGERLQNARSLFFRAQVRAILLSGIVLLITLTWNSTFEKLFERFFGDRDRFIAQIAYSLFLTGILFLILYLITRSSFTPSEKLTPEALANAVAGPPVDPGVPPSASEAAAVAT